MVAPYGEVILFVENLTNVLAKNLSSVRQRDEIVSTIPFGLTLTKPMRLSLRQDGDQLRFIPQDLMSCCDASIF